jgi:hypothetical protein
MAHCKKKNLKNMHPQLINVNFLMNCIEFVIQIDEYFQIEAMKLRHTWSMLPNVN